MFWLIVYNRAKEKLHQNFCKVVVHMSIIDQWNHIVRLYEIQVRVIYSRAILVAVMSEFCVKRIIWKTWRRFDQNWVKNTLSYQDLKIPKLLL